MKNNVLKSYISEKPLNTQFPWWCKSSPTTMATTSPLPQSSGSASGSGSGSQGVVLCPRTLSQVRRTRLRRALTEATADTVNYVKTVGPLYFSFIYFTCYTINNTIVIYTHSRINWLPFIYFVILQYTQYIYYSRNYIHSQIVLYCNAKKKNNY